jgi:hypothetical protein
MMKLEDQAMKYLAATDSTVWLTYDEYVRDRINDGGKPITAGEWDMIGAIAGNRKLQDTAVVSQILLNMRLASKNVKDGKD